MLTLRRTALSDWCRSPFGRFSMVMLAATLFAAHLPGQSTSAAQGLSTKSGDESSTQLAVPGGAGATVTGTGTAGAGPLIGFQVWQQDRFFLSSFFTFSPPQTVSGQQHDFGAFLLNPPGQGTSFAFIGNKVFGVYLNAHSKPTYRKSRAATAAQRVAIAAGVAVPAKAATVDDAILFWGFGARTGVTNTTWQSGTGDTQQSAGGTVVYFVPEFAVTSKTYKLKDTQGKDTNQYQFGASVGPTFRAIGGDLAQTKQDSFRATLLGTDKKSYAGFEVTFFVRMNQFKPYVRFTHFASPATNLPHPAQGIDVAGFSGSQFVFGVDVLSAIFQTKLP